MPQDSRCWSESEIVPIGTKLGENVIVIRAGHRLVSHDPAKNLPVGNRQKRFKTRQTIGIQPAEMRIGEGGKDQVELAEAAPLSPEQSFFSADLDFGQFTHPGSI